MKKTLNLVAVLLITLLSLHTLTAGTIGGKVLYQGDSTRPIGNVTVALKNLGTNAIQTFTTTGNGIYQFSNVVNGNYKLTGTTANVSGGVTYYDAVMVFLNIIGVYQFSPMEFLGSDVNGSGTITWSDYNLIISHLLWGTPFPVGPWRFESPTFTISNFKDGVPHGLGGTCSGDVGGTFVPQYNNTPALPVAQTGTINVGCGEPFTTQIITNKQLSITGAGIVITYPSELLNIESVDFKGTDYQYSIDGNKINIVWGNPKTAAINFASGETFVTLHGTTTGAFKAGMAANFGLDGNTNLIDASNQEVKNLSFATPLIQASNATLKLSNFPNPFTASTKLSVFNTADGVAKVEIFSATGQLVKTIAIGDLNAGYHEIDLDASQLAPGYYVCRLHLQNTVGETTKAIRLVKSE
jgi:hypothetical protein